MRAAWGLVLLGRLLFGRPGGRRGSGFGAREVAKRDRPAFEIAALGAGDGPGRGRRALPNGGAIVAFARAAWLGGFSLIGFSLIGFSLIGFSLIGLGFVGALAGFRFADRGGPGVGALRVPLGRPFRPIRTRAPNPPRVRFGRAQA